MKINDSGAKCLLYSVLAVVDTTQTRFIIPCFDDNIKQDRWQHLSYNQNKCYQKTSQKAEAVILYLKQTSVISMLIQAAAFSYYSGSLFFAS